MKYPIARDSFFNPPMPYIPKLCRCTSTKSNEPPTSVEDSSLNESRLRCISLLMGYVEWSLYTPQWRRFDLFKVWSNRSGVLVNPDLFGPPWWSQTLLTLLLYQYYSLIREFSSHPHFPLCFYILHRATGFPICSESTISNERVKEWVPEWKVC